MEVFKYLPEELKKCVVRSLDNSYQKEFNEWAAMAHWQIDAFEECIYTFEGEVDEDNFYPIVGECVEGLRELCQKLMLVNGVKTIVLSAGCLWKWVFLLEVFGFVVPDYVRDWPGLLEVDVFNMTIGQRQYNHNDEPFNVGDVYAVSVGIFINPDCINQVRDLYLQSSNVEKTELLLCMKHGYV